MTGALRATRFELTVAADPAALSVVRRVTGAFSLSLGLEDSDVADLRLAVTEVCSSFIAARPDPNPPAGLRIRASVSGNALEVSVLDPASPPPGPGTGPPLPLLAALTRDLELRGAPGGGMEVRMTFAALPTS
ncbi:MAG: ATP-binding protein [Solirubrobacterales bacterium]|nr:ATP-binding protein [Solirubrobacterales bacterium]